jgi:L-threonylcarbamoyladenylate synthase
VGTEPLIVDPRRPEAPIIARAAQILRDGGLVAFPTETFYGLGAAALDARAARRVLDVKGRPDGKPLLVLVDGIAMAESLAASVPPAARALMERWWPGAVTIVLRASPHVPREVTAGTGTVGVRRSPHPVARDLVAALGAPITAPSANPTDEPPPTTGDEALAYFDGMIEAVLHGGPTAGGPPSTVVDATVDPPIVIRQGAVAL